MHELSIAQSLVSTALPAAERAGVTEVTAVRLRLGAMSGVVAGALEFGYEIVTKGTLLEGTTLVIEHVPLVIHCECCDVDVEMAEIGFRCPTCDTPSPTIVSGREIELVALEYVT